MLSIKTVFLTLMTAACFAQTPLDEVIPAPRRPQKYIAAPISWNQLSTEFVSFHDSYSKDAARYLVLKKDLKQLEARMDAVRKNDPSLGPKDAFETTEAYQKRINDRNLYYQEQRQLQQSVLLKEETELKSRYYTTTSYYQVRFLPENYNADLSSWKIFITEMGNEHSTNISISPADAKILWDNRSSLKATRVVSLSDTTRVLLLISATGLQNPVFLAKQYPGIGETASGKNQVEAGDKDIVFLKVEKEAEFPGGTEGWKRYLERNLNPQIPVDNGAPEGNHTVIVRFIVSKDGSLSDLRCEKDPGYGMCQEAIKVITKGPKWIPAYQNGRSVNAYRSQPISFAVAGE
jgi:hypothetical protein